MHHDVFMESSAICGSCTRRHNENCRSQLYSEWFCSVNCKEEYEAEKFGEQLSNFITRNPEGFKYFLDLANNK